MKDDLAGSEERSSARAEGKLVSFSPPQSASAAARALTDCADCAAVATEQAAVGSPAPVTARHRGVVGEKQDVPLHRSGRKKSGGRKRRPHTDRPFVRTHSLQGSDGGYGGGDGADGAEKLDKSAVRKKLLGKRPTTKRRKPKLDATQENDAELDSSTMPAGAGAGRNTSTQHSTPSATGAADDQSDPTADKVLEEFKCCFCQDLMVGAHSVACGHTFCGECVMTWLQRRKRCPICRKRARSAWPVRPIDQVIAKIVGSMPPGPKAEFEARKAVWDESQAALASSDEDECSELMTTSEDDDEEESDDVEDEDGSEEDDEDESRYEAAYELASA